MQTIHYLGKKYPIKAVLDESRKRISISLREDHVLIETNKAEAYDYQADIARFYKKQAKKYIEGRLRHFQPGIKKKYKTFKIESSDKRWGSCNSKGELTFNWKLMLFPAEAIDYVVVHELCHLEHLNHDRSFWRLVGKLCPDYKAIMPILGTSKTRDL